MNLSQIMLKAADILDERGWNRHQLEDEKGRLCVAAAIKSAAPTLLFADIGRDIAPLLGCNDYDALTGWNYKARNRREVTRRLRSAAKRLEREGV